MSDVIAFPNSTIVRTIIGGLRTVALVKPALAARAATYLFFRTPPRRPTLPEEAERLAQGSAFRIPHEGGPLQATRWGSGPTVVLVHGWGGNAAQMTAFVQPLVTQGFSVVAIDFAGHGTSPGSRGSIPDVARTLIDARQQIGPIHGIIAHSLGVSASLLALHLGLQVDAVVAVAGPAQPIRWYDAWVGGVVGEMHLARERARVEGVFGLSFDLLDGPSLAETRHEPLLWIHDEDDKEVAHAAGKATSAAWPDARFESTSGLGHKRILRDEHVVTITTEFLARRAFSRAS